MRPSLRTLAPTTHFSTTATLEALGDVFTAERLTSALDRCGRHTRRLRKLPLTLVILLCIAINLFTDEAIEDVLRKLLQGARFLRPDDPVVPASAGAICRRRQHLGSAPLRLLFQDLCRPLATPATKDAFLFGFRLMAIDGTTEDVPDTEANAKVFGRPTGSRGEGAFPQLKAVYLCEAGTHAIVDAGWWPSTASERPGGLRLLRSVGRGMLVLWDGGFHSYAMCRRCLRQGAQFLSRLPAQAKPKVVQRLPDGSFLTDLRPREQRGQRRVVPLRVRVITYQLDDPGRPGYGEIRRLVTSLLDPAAYPAHALVLAYHERWEVEVTIDELDTHQRQVRRPFRSRTPDGVIQEFYALLLAHYAIRRVMHEAALQADLPPDRLSFIKTVRIIRSAVFECQILDAGPRQRWYQQLVREIGQAVLPTRANRVNPRVVKQKMSKFDRKRPEHRPGPQPTKPFADAILLIGTG